MVWKSAWIVAALWILESVFHLSMGLIVLIGIAGVMGVVAQTIVSSRRLADIRGTESGLDG